MSNNLPIRILNSIDHFPQAPTEEQFEALMSGIGGDLLLEPVTLEDLDESISGDYKVEPDQLLSAITTKRVRLARTMKALVMVLNKNLDPGKGLVAGVTEDMEVEAGTAVLGGAILSKPRRSGLIAIMTAEIPFSDGQSVFIVFHAPDDDPAVIGQDDTLIAFRFLLNKRDVTDFVAPRNGRDISLKQTAMSVTKLVERNSNRFRASQRVKKEQLKDIATLQSKVDSTIQATSDMVRAVDEKDQEQATVQASVESLRQRLENQLAVNATLEQALSVAAPEPAAAAPEQAPVTTEVVERKYVGEQFVGEKYAATKGLPATEIAKKIRLDITDGRVKRKYPADLRVSVTTSANAIRLEINALPDGFNIHSQEYVREYAETGKYPSGVDGLKRHTAALDSLMNQLHDEANKYNKNDSDMINDYSNRRFYLSVDVKSEMEKADLKRQVAAFKAENTAPQAPVVENEANQLPKPTAYRDGSNFKPIEINATENELRALGQAEIQSVGGENIYIIKDGLHYYSKVYNTEWYKAGPWDFAANPLGIKPAEVVVPVYNPADIKPAHEMAREDWIRQRIETNDYAAEYLADKQLYDDKARTLENDWVAELKEHAKVGRVSTEALDDFVAIFGVNALLSVFRGIYAPGIEGYEPPTVNRLWDRTYQQVLRLNRSQNIFVNPNVNIKEFHREMIIKALDAGENVPANVLKDYPELALRNPAEVTDPTLPDAAPVAEVTAPEVMPEPVPETTPEPEVVPEADPVDPTAGFSPEVLAVQREITALEEQSSRMKGANAIVRKYIKAKEKDEAKARAEAIPALEDLKLPASFLDLKPDFLGNVVPFASYKLTNLNAEIRRKRERLIELEARDAAAAEGDLDLDLTFNGAPVNVEVDIDDDRIRVRFPNLTRRAVETNPEYEAERRIAPSSSWSRANSAWQRKITSNAKRDTAWALGYKNWDELVNAGKSAAAIDVPAEEPEVVSVPEQQEPAAVAVPEQSEPEAPEVVAELEALKQLVDTTSDADELMDALDQALSVLGADGEEKHADLLERASNRVTELLEAQ